MTKPMIIVQRPAIAELGPGPGPGRAAAWAQLRVTVPGRLAVSPVPRCQWAAEIGLPESEARVCGRLNAARRAGPGRWARALTVGARRPLLPLDTMAEELDRDSRALIQNRLPGQPAGGRLKGHHAGWYRQGTALRVRRWLRR